MVPTVYNDNSIGYNPDRVSAPRKPTPGPRSSTRSSRARRGLNADPLIAFGQAVMAMNTLEAARRARTPAIPTRRRSRKASKFLISKKKDGQFRALWGDFGELVNLLASGEMMVARRLATGRDGGEGAGQAMQLCGAEGRLPRLGDRRRPMIAGTPNKDAVTAYADYLALRPAGHHGLGAGLLLAHDQHPEGHGPRQIRLLVRGQAVEGRTGARHQGGRSARWRLARRPAPTTSPTGTSGPTNTTT